MLVRQVHEHREALNSARRRQGSDRKAVPPVVPVADTSCNRPDQRAIDESKSSTHSSQPLISNPHPPLPSGGISATRQTLELRFHQAASPAESSIGASAADKSHARPDEGPSGSNCRPQGPNDYRTALGTPASIPFSPDAQQEEDERPTGKKAPNHPKEAPEIAADRYQDVNGYIGELCNYEPFWEKLDMLVNLNLLDQ